MKVFVYRNLNKKGFVYSLKAVDGKYKGKVIGYSSSFGLHTAKMKVSEKGRQRVLKEKKKNVHAGIVGEILYVNDYQPRNTKIKVTNPAFITADGKQITYNPYKYTSFVESDTEQPIVEARYVSFNHEKVTYSNF